MVKTGNDGRNLFTANSGRYGPREKKCVVWSKSSAESLSRRFGIGSLILLTGSRSVFVGVVQTGCVFASRLADGKVFLRFYSHYSGQNARLYKTGSKVRKKSTENKRTVGAEKA